MNIRNVATWVLLATLAAGASAQTVNWTADRTLRIEFQMPISAWPLQPNTFYVAGGYVTIQQPHTLLTLTMYNGAALMGTAEARGSAGRTGVHSYHPFGTSFQTADSSFGSYLGTPAIIDFTPVLDRSIQGRIDVNIDAGNILLNLQSAYLSLTEYIPGRIYGQAIYPSPYITSIKLIPELPTDPPPPPPATPTPTVFGPGNNSLMSPASLRAYCDQAKGSAIVFNNHVTITAYPSEIVVKSGCIIELAPNVNLVFDGVLLKFEGPLTIQSQGRAGVKLLKSRLTAPGIAITTPGEGGIVTSSESTLRADGGPMTIALGDESKFEIAKRHSTQTDALWSSHQVTIGAGGKFTAGFLGANVYGNQGILVDIAGDEGSVKAVDGVAFNAPQGAVRIAGTGVKSLVEMSDAQVSFGESLAFSMAGNESTLKLKKTTLGPSSGTATGGISLEAGDGSANLGMIEGAEVALRGVQSASITAATNGSGVVKWEKGVANVAGDVLLQGGNLTEVKDSNITSTTLIRIFTTGGGSCNNGANILSAPVVEICPAF